MMRGVWWGDMPWGGGCVTTVVCAVCMCGFALSRRFQYVVVRIFEGSNIFPALHFPRTDAAECDTHFYVISALGIIYTRGLMSSGADTVCGDIGTAYTGFDNLDFYYLF